MKKNFSKVKVSLKALVFIVAILVVFIFCLLKVGELLGWQSRGVDGSSQLAKAIGTGGGGADEEEEDSKSYEVARASCPNGSTNYCGGGCCVAGEKCVDLPPTYGGVCSPDESQCQQNEVYCPATGSSERRIGQCCPAGNGCETVRIPVPNSPLHPLTDNDIYVAKCRPPLPPNGCPPAQRCGSQGTPLCCSSSTRCVTQSLNDVEVAGCFPSGQTSCSSGWAFCRGSGTAENVSRCCQYGCGASRPNGMPGACNPKPASGEIKTG